ncbi:hypothetical protein ACFW9F_15650 [Streptomyces sp. NPDC059506]|uniref:hypothetical protein n=1 Tax=Streptomyces TaxID=1883 RepID=UPI0015FD816A|nr:hypothetical protein [Streptomyces sp. SCUT-3]QMV24299.1 hypothetical protein GQS52_23805 [Streptomyces sp. SCUT-3]
MNVDEYKGFRLHDHGADPGFRGGTNGGIPTSDRKQPVHRTVEHRVQIAAAAGTAVFALAVLLTARRPPAESCGPTAHRQ